MLCKTFPFFPLIRFTDTSYRGACAPKNVNKTKVESDQIGRLLKSSIISVQRAAIPENGVVFCQKSIGSIRCSVGTSYDYMRHQTPFRPIRSLWWWVDRWVGWWVGVWCTLFSDRLFPYQAPSRSISPFEINSKKWSPTALFLGPIGSC